MRCLWNINTLLKASLHGSAELMQDQAISCSETPWIILYSPLSMLKTLRMRPRGAREVEKRRGMVQGPTDLHVDCRLDNKYPQSPCGICVMYVHGGVAPEVIQPFGEAWATFSSCKPLVTERRLELTFQYAETLENAPWQWQGSGRGAAGSRQRAGNGSRLTCNDWGMG